MHTALTCIVKYYREQESCIELAVFYMKTEINLQNYNTCNCHGCKKYMCV